CNTLERRQDKEMEETKRTVCTSRGHRKRNIHRTNPKNQHGPEKEHEERRESEQEDITTYKVLECGQINLTLSNHKMTLTVQNIKPTVGTTTTKSQGSTHDQTEMDIDTDIPKPEPYQEQTENDMQIDRPEIDRTSE
ncbi:3983_t:CDS:2, partial [Gigaspora rosea]